MTPETKKAIEWFRKNIAKEFHDRHGRVKVGFEKAFVDPYDAPQQYKNFRELQENKLIEFREDYAYEMGTKFRVMYVTITSTGNAVMAIDNL